MIVVGVGVVARVNVGSGWLWDRQTEKEDKKDENDYYQSFSLV